MNDDTKAPRGSLGRLLLRPAGLVAAGVLAGGILAGTLAASADTSSTATPSASSSSSSSSSGSSSTGSSGSSSQAAPQQRGPVGGATPVRSDEKALTGTTADKVKAAALAAVPGGTVYRVETDADGYTYEAHMTKADGTAVTVKLNADFSVAAVQDGMGSGPNGSAGGRAPGVPGGGNGNGSSGSGSSSGSASPAA